MRNFREDYLTAADASVDQTGVAIPASQLFAFAVQVILTGAATGAVKVQASNDNPNIAGNPTNWVDITDADVTLGAAGQFLIPKFDACYQFLRVVYTKNNGSAGTVTVKISGLGV